MALWKARGGKVYHGIVHRQGGEVQIKTWNLDHGIVEGKGGKFK